MDFYLKDDNFFNRIVKEWEEHKNLIIAYDFDNTVYDFHDEGHSYKMVIELLKECKQLGAYLMVYTARKGEELYFVESYLNENNIPFDSINETPSFLPFEDGKKLYYNVLLDDRAGLSSAYKALKKACKIIKSKIQVNKNEQSSSK